MKTTVNNNNIESNNGMSQVVIDLRPQVKHHEGYGREKVADVYFRTQVRAYSRQVCGDYSEAAHEAAEKATAAYYSEVVELLKGEGWTLLNDYAHWHTCPELTKGDQYLYVHPDSISGEVNPADIDALEAKFKALTACEYRGTDNYGDIVLTRSEADERMLYRETYTEGIAATIKECTTTKRSNLYKDRGDALGCIRNRIAIQNKRTDLTGHGTGYYRERKAVAGFVQEEYDRLLQAGYIKEAMGQNGRTLCRWINKKEEKELTKARREAEKAEKERKAQEWQEFLDREAEKQNSFADGMRVKVPAASLERNRDKEAFVITRIRRKAADNGGNASLTVKSELTGVERDINGSDVSEILPALQEASEITEQREQNDACISSAESRRDKANGQIKDDSFFIKGKKYRCIKSVKGDFTKGKVYEQSSDPTQWYGYFHNDKGILHVWPQPTQIDHSCELYDMKPEDIDPRLYFEPVEDVKEADFSDTLTDDLKAGDRVLSRHYGAQATVLGREWDKQRKAWYYRVQFDTMQRHMDGSEFNVTEFHRDGLTKNYDPATGRERVGNAEYYRENLLAEFWGNDHTPRTVYGMEIFKPTDRRPSWLVVADIFSEPKEMTLREVCDMLAARYQEEQGEAA